MRRLARTDIVKVLMVLNWHHGRGDLVRVNVPGRWFLAKPYSCRPERRRFRVEGRTVFAYGHQRTVPI